MLIYDRFLESHSPQIRRWIQRFKYRYPVQAGESLKQLASFPAHFESLLALSAEISPKELCFVSLGGGSVGDFTGFVASTFKRGVGLIHFPSTWLAAMDSVHGGKTALNAGGIKNTIGTFYPASRVYLVKSLLESQPPARQQEALGELAKTALIDGGPWVKRLGHSPGALTNERLWEFLPDAIRSKMKVVNADPLESNGHRRLLNLGHTLGHVIESHHEIAHGKAVAQGLIFSLLWSGERKLLSAKATQARLRWLKDVFNIVAEPQPLTQRKFDQLLNQDKKKASSQSVYFIFITSRGCKIEKVHQRDLIREARRQGWIKK